MTDLEGMCRCGASKYAFCAPSSLGGADPSTPAWFMLCFKCDMASMERFDEYGRPLGTAIVGPPRLLAILRTGSSE